MNIFRSIAVAVVFVGLVAGTSQASPVFQWTGPGSNGHFYVLTDTALNWTDADTLATSRGGYLVSILSQAENDFLQATFFPTAQEPFWIGLTDQTTEGTFAWTSGEAVSFTNWQPGEPNDFHGGLSPTGEDYTAINWHFTHNLTTTRGTWNDLPNFGCLGPTCATAQPLLAIIEFDTIPVPEPSSLLLISTGFITCFLRSGIIGAIRQIVRRFTLA